MKTILAIRHISKSYGRIRALNDISFEVPPASVFGILGPNGSGKTTLLGIVMNVLRASGGSYSWFGEPPNDLQRKQIGTLLETPNFYHYLSGRRNLQIAAAIKGRSEQDIPRVLDIVRLTERGDSKFSTYSLGMKQRLAIASCLLGDPSVLVFDEPTNGLDPAGIAETRDMIRNLASAGKTVILASHLLDEVEKVCTHVAILRKGTLLTAGDVNEVLIHEEWVELGASAGSTLSDAAVLAGTPIPVSLQGILASLPGVRVVHESEGRFQVFFDRERLDPGQINRLCFERGVVLDHLQLRKRSLESKFIELMNSGAGSPNTATNSSAGSNSNPGSNSKN